MGDPFLMNGNLLNFGNFIKMKTGLYPTPPSYVQTRPFSTSALPEIDPIRFLFFSLMCNIRCRFSWQCFLFSAKSSHILKIFKMTSAETKSHGLFSFKDEKTQPDPVFEYPCSIADSNVPLIIDNGNFCMHLSCKFEKMGFIVIGKFRGIVQKHHSIRLFYVCNT